MRLSLQSDYALRLLMHLAINNTQLVTINEIAERYAISRNHLMKVANLLGRADLIETVRGRSGGLRLARDASKINVGDVIRETETDMMAMECMSSDSACLISPACRLSSVLDRATQAFMAVLDEFTIFDLVTDNAVLQSLIQIELLDA